MLDRYIWGEVSRISPEAPVPVVHVRSTSEVLGGAGNVAANLAGLGCRVSILGLCGEDAAGARLRALLQQQRIGDLLTTDGPRPTITKTRVMVQQQQLLRLDEENTGGMTNALAQRQLANLEAVVDDVAVVILSDYGKGFLQTPHLAQDMLKLCQRKDIPVLVDPKGRDWSRYAGADCITPNTSEVALASGRETATEAQLLEAAAGLRRDCNAQRLLVTRGPLGMCLLDEASTPFMIAARAREVFDVSGAGDTVVATLGAGLALGHSYRQAAELANLAAGIVVGKLGTQPIRVDELQQALDLQTPLCEDAFTTPSGVHKIMDWPAARRRLTDWQAHGLRVVFTNGCFDILHPGHIHLLQQARNLGDRLIVGLNSDISVRRLKGSRRPVLAAADRSTLLGALACVDGVVIFNEDTPLELITHLKPDILVKGADYQLTDVVGRAIVEAYGGTVRLLPLLNGFSTSAIVAQIEHQGGTHEH